jgi:hypothetical protein
MLIWIMTRCSLIGGYQESTASLFSVQNLKKVYSEMNDNSYTSHKNLLRWYVIRSISLGLEEVISFID